MDKIISEQLIKKMRLGWNLGNTLDAPAGETSWGNPVTTREMIKKIHSLGFETLRVPVSWHRHLDEDLNIASEWLDRVNEIVDYAYDDGMYCILNIHHDDARFQPTAEGFEGGSQYIKAVWGQLCGRFEDYDERLIFEAMNEPRIIRSRYEWHLDFSEKVCLDALEYINRYNQIFVDTVRSTRKNNISRFLMTPSYAAAPHHAFIPAFRPANDPADRLVISVHSYSPIELSLMPNPAVTEFTPQGEKELSDIFERLNRCFVKKGLPVVIGEMGMQDKNNPDDRRRWAEYFVSEARKNGMPVVWWDNGGRDFRLFDRRSLEVYESSKCVLEGLLAGLK